MGFAGGFSPLGCGNIFILVLEGGQVACHYSDL